MADDILAQVLWRFRRRGIALIFVGALVAVGSMIAADMPLLSEGDRPHLYLIGALGMGLAAFGLRLALRVPAFLRSPHEIERIDTIAPIGTARMSGGIGEMQAVMRDGEVCRFAVEPGEREAIKTALEARMHAALSYTASAGRVPARRPAVVSRSDDQARTPS